MILTLLRVFPISLPEERRAVNAFIPPPEPAEDVSVPPNQFVVGAGLGSSLRHHSPAPKSLFMSPHCPLAPGQTTPVQPQGHCLDTVTPQLVACHKWHRFFLPDLVLWKGFFYHFFCFSKPWLAETRAAADTFCSLSGETIKWWNYDVSFLYRESTDLV